jgi:Cu+-exporting ATPase
MKKIGNKPYMLSLEKIHIFQRTPIRMSYVILMFCCYLVVATAGVSAHAQMEGMHDHPMTAKKGVHVRVDLKTTPSALKAGSPSKILLILKDADGRPVQNLTMMHDRQMHVVISSADFSIFAHIHPEDFGPITEEMRNKAEYPVRFTFPKAGKYIIGVDFAVGDRPFSRHFTVEVAGRPKMGSYAKDLSLQKEFCGLRVAFSSVPGKIVAGEAAVLRYVFKEKGEPVKDLEPYLAAPMHVAVISSDLRNFIHAHGEIPGMDGRHPRTGHEAMHMNVPGRFGPEIDVPVVFPEKGLYQIFGQVKYKGNVILLSFMIEVE